MHFSFSLSRLWDKRKFKVSNNESPLQDGKWVQFRDRALEIKPRQSSKSVDIHGVPVQEGLSTSVCLKDVISSGVGGANILQNLYHERF